MLNDGATTSPKKKSYGLAALVVLCLAVTSFLAGRTYGLSSSKGASLMVEGVGQVVCNDPTTWRAKVRSDCGGDDMAAYCVYMNILGYEKDITKCGNGTYKCDTIAIGGMKRACID